MELIDLWGGQVFQLELDRWWDGHVIANYEEHRDSFPGQDEIAKLVAEGAVFHGPFAGWDFEPEEVHRPDFAAEGYARGVPMGADLFSGPDHTGIRVCRARHN